jgi:hypothetical protein
MPEGVAFSLSRVTFMPISASDTFFTSFIFRFSFLFSAVPDRAWTPGRFN